MIAPSSFAFAMLAATATAASAEVDPAQTEAAPKKEATEKTRAEPKPEGDTIVVEGRTMPVKRTVEGAAYDVRDNAQGQAGSAADVLNSVPAVNVSPDGNVTVRGEGNVQVFVNGRPSAAMSGEGRGAALQAMSGGSVASVEVITNPSARFDSNGGTILNIVLKKVQKSGLGGTLSANAGDRGRKNAGVNVSYGGGSVSAALSASLRDDVRLTHLIDERLIFAGDGSIARRFLTVSRYTPTHSRSANLSGSIGYALTSTADLGLDLTLSGGSPKNRVFERHVDEEEGAVSEYRRVRGGTYVRDNFDLSAYYDSRSGPAGRTLKLVAQHSAASLRSDRLFTTFYDLPPLAPTAERVLNRSVTRIDRAAADHERPIGAKLRLGFGAEWKRELSRFDNGRAAFDPADPLAGALEPSAFEAVQRTAAAYATVQFRSGPWTVQAGERFEDLRIETARAPDGFRSERHLAGFNHSLSALRDVGDDQAIFRLSRTRQRFDPRDLNPALVYIDAQNLATGNPLLEPQDVTAAEAEYSFRRGTLEGAATVYHRRTDDTIAPFSEFRADNVLVTSKRNGGRSKSLGGQLTLSDRLGKRLKYSLTGNLFHAELSVPDGESKRRQSRLSYSAQASVDWSPTARDQLRLDANVQGPSLVPQGVRTGTGAANFVWRRTISPEWTLSLTAQGVVLDNRVRTVIRTLNALNVNDRLSGGRAVFVGVSYRIR